MTSVAAAASAGAVQEAWDGLHPVLRSFDNQAESTNRRLEHALELAGLQIEPEA